MNKITNSLFVLFLFFIPLIYAQVGIGNTNPKSLLDLSIQNISSPEYKDGLLIPRMNNFPATNPGSNQNSMLVYLNNNLTGVNISGTSKNYSSGFYYWDNSLTDWINMNQSPVQGWSLEGNNNATSGTHFLGTTNSEEVDFKVNDKLIGRLTELGQFELQSDERSLFIGVEAGENYSALSGTTEQNVFIGYHAGRLNSSGRDNVALGAFALSNSTTGNFNTVLGDEALQDNITGNANTAIGNDTLRRNTSGSDNAAIGEGALGLNTSGNENVAIGAKAMKLNTSSSNNVAIGSDALLKISTGGFNTAIGFNSAKQLERGTANISIGAGSGATVPEVHRSISIGNNSDTANDNTIGIGYSSITGSFGSIAIGHDAETDGLNSMAIGRLASTDGTNSIAIGNMAQTTKNNQIVLGNNSITEVKTSGVVKADSFLAVGSGTTYADYVFEDYYDGYSKIKSDYKFNTLDAAEIFVKKHGHLPGVKSYNEVMKNGFHLDLTKATITNLEKLEEQFIYITELKKQIKEQNKIQNQQDEKIKLLENRLKNIERLLTE